MTKRKPRRRRVRQAFAYVWDKTTKRVRRLWSIHRWEEEPPSKEGNPKSKN